MALDAFCSLIAQHKREKTVNVEQLVQSQKEAEKNIKKKSRVEKMTKK